MITRIYNVSSTKWRVLHRITNLFTAFTYRLMHPPVHISKIRNKYCRIVGLFFYLKICLTVRCFCGKRKKLFNPISISNCSISNFKYYKLTDYLTRGEVCIVILANSGIFHGKYDDVWKRPINSFAFQTSLKKLTLSHSSAVLSLTRVKKS